MSQHILALDPATSTGFASSDPSIGYGVWNLGTLIGPGYMGMRTDALRKNILDVHARRCIRVIAVEDAARGSHNFNAQAFQWQLRGVIEQVGYEIGARVVGFNPGTIKAFATGSGRADKARMCRAARDVLGIDVYGQDDVADALWILELAKRPDRWVQPKAKGRKRPPKNGPGKQKSLFAKRK